MTPKALSREIKFRAWNDSKKDWEGNFSISRIGSFLRLGISQSTEGIHVMQFTGLHDKNGKEIYIGDIVKHSDNRIREVQWIGTTMDTGVSDNVTDGECGSPEPSDVEVIGNIYESKHLLDNTDTKG